MKKINKREKRIRNIKIIEDKINKKISGR